MFLQVYYFAVTKISTFKKKTEREAMIKLPEENSACFKTDANTFLIHTEKYSVLTVS